MEMLERIPRIKVTNKVLRDSAREYNELCILPYLEENDTQYVLLESRDGLLSDIGIKLDGMSLQQGLDALLSADDVMEQVPATLGDKIHMISLFRYGERLNLYCIAVPMSDILILSDRYLLVDVDVLKTKSNDEFSRSLVMLRRYL